MTIQTLDPRSSAAVAAVVDIIGTPGRCGLDTETTVERNVYKRDLCTVQVAHEDGREAMCQIFGNPGGLAAVTTALHNAKADFVAHNAIFEIEMARKYGARIESDCTMLAFKTLRGAISGRDDENDGAVGYSFKDCMMRELGEDVDKTEQVSDWTQELTSDQIDYAMLDARGALDLWYVCEAEFDAQPWQYTGYRYIAEALPAIASTNSIGMQFNKVAHAALCSQLADEMDVLKLELDGWCDYKIDNHGSAKQVGEWLATSLFGEGTTPRRTSLLFKQITGVDWPLTTSGQLSTGKPILIRILGPLMEYAEAWPGVGQYITARLAYTKAKKIIEAFGPKLADMVDEDGMLRGNFIPFGARTTRMSARKPNLQQMPREAIFRALFEARKGRVMIIADYGQIELRVGCIIADDKTMQKVFTEGLDIHAATAANILKVPYDPGNPAHVKARKNYKPVTFAVLYGAQALAVAMASGLPLDEAQKLLDDWLDAYPTIRTYRETQPGDARALGYIELVSGQRIPLMDDARPAQMINAPVQGSSATVLYRAAKLVDERLHAFGLDARVAGLIHDEIIIDAHPYDAPMAKTILEDAMKEALLEFYPQAAEMQMDQIAEAEIVSNWSEKP